MLSKENKKYILKYIELNKEMFEFLDIEKLTQRITENFSGVNINWISFLYNDFGQYTPTTGKILLSPSLLIGKNRKYRESVFYHELDHCACTPIKVKHEYNQLKSKIKEKHKYLYRLIPNFILSEIFLKIHYEGPISGIANLERQKGYMLQKLSYGTKLENYLNEGITSLKQKMYSDKLEIKFHKKKDFFYGARIGAECLGNVIGFENMISLHFNNDLQTIKQQFLLKTGIDLEQLIIKCAIYDQKRKKKKLNELQDFIQQIYKICDKN